MQTTLPDGPLTGLKVVDLSRVLAGPYCSMALGDMGAEIIKIERPDGGDDTRRFGPPFVEGVSTYYLAINRNKRSVALNLKHPDAKAILWQLIDEADVLLENFRPGALDRLGFDYAACAARNPRLIYCSISAFGHAGLPEWSRRPGYDVIMQGMGGIPSLTGPPDAGPHKVGASIADVVSGMYATQGVLFALMARERTGRGQQVDISMFDGQVSLLTYLATAQLNAGLTPGRLGNRHLSVAPYSTFAAADGHLNLAVANQKLWARFCALLERPDLETDPRFATNADRVRNVDALDALIAPALAARSVTDWLAAFEAVGIPAGPVLTVDQVLAHPQLAARDMIVEMEHPVAGTVRATGIPVRLEGTPGRARTAPPELGADTDAVLTDLGYDAKAIAALRTSGAVGMAP
jgi:crotonobetainyl-CoA:carnitine CoA-transferase CaiB-like acyl-CoA transferase